MQNKKKIGMILFLLLAFSLGLVIRVLFLPAKTLDMNGYLEWYDYIVQEGILNSIGDTFYIYTPPYIYLLSLATLTKSFIPQILAIKLISLTFEVLSLFVVYQIVKNGLRDTIKASYAAALFWIAPTIMINSSFWGETDSLYTFFILLCLLFLLKGYSIAAIIAFGVGFSIKAQSVFILPFLIILCSKKKIAWKSILLIPIVYTVMMLPAFFMGRSFNSLIFAYVNQGMEFKKVSMNAANFYFFLENTNYQLILVIGISLAILIVSVWILIYSQKSASFNVNKFALTALISVALIPFLLPKMHDRYFYLADVLSIIVIFFIPRMWFIPVAYQTISLLSYMPYLFGFPPDEFIPIAILINMCTISFLLYQQHKMVFGKNES